MFHESDKVVNMTCTFELLRRFCTPKRVFFRFESTILSENGYDSVRASDYANGSLPMSCKSSWKR